MPRETKQACRAVRVLTQQYLDAQAANAQELGAMALEAAGLSVDDGWKYNLQAGVLERETPDEETQP